MKTKNYTAVVEWPITKTPQPQDTHQSGIASDELPAAKTSITPATPTATLAIDGVTWDGTETNLTKDSKSLAALRRYFFGFAPSFKTKAELAQFVAQRRIVGRAIHEAEQGLPVIESAKPTFDRERHIGRAESRAEIIAKLEALHDGDALQTAPLRITATDPLILRAIVDESKDNILKGLLFVGRSCLANYAIKFWRLLAQIHCRDRADEIRLELSHAADLSLDRITELRQELSSIETTAAELIAHSAAVKLNADYAPVREISAELLNELVAVLERHKASVISSEQFFFSQHDLPHEATTASRRYDTLLKNIRGQIDRLKNPQGPVNHKALHPSLNPIIGAPFGLEILPGIL